MAARVIARTARFGAVALLLGCNALIGITDLPPLRTDGGVGSDAGDASVPQLTSNKVDILFAIDNSRSMGDKQDLLASKAANVIKQFPNLPDLHIAFVSSSLGGGGAEQAGGQPICPPTATEPLFKQYNAHNDDKGWLLNRVKPTAANGSGIEDTVANALPINAPGGTFLAWLPGKQSNSNVPVEPDQTTLANDFATLVRGMQEYGCGLEAQLESWYRFLIQPDPYDSIAISVDPKGGPPKATLVGIDATIIRQRADFLRPDSIVVIVQVTDEEDSWTDPLALDGRGWTTRASVVPGSPTNLMPRGTSACDTPIDPTNPTATGPNDPNCTSCGLTGNMANGQPISSDPNCTLSCGANCAGYWTGKDDNLNIRYTNDVKRRYGLGFQFPVQRYIDGLTSQNVPDRNGEHASGAGPYLGQAYCINPLFASSLPTGANDTGLCDGAIAPSTTRNASLVYYMIVGGVPYQLVGDKSAVKTLNSADWTTIVGRDPIHYDYTGIDPHMIESYLPRTSKNKASIPYLSGSLSDITALDNADPYNGREWDTTLSPLGLDLQYACTFDLATPKECSDAANVNACDCVNNAVNPGGPPLCAAGANGKSLQVRGKAYPTIRELLVARGMGDHGVAASLCLPNDPFTPAFTALRAKLTVAIAK